MSGADGNHDGAVAASPPSAPDAIAPEFGVLGVDWAPDAATPTLLFELSVSEASGCEVFTIALTAQINVDPARRSYDDDTRAALVDLFGEPGRWPATTHSFLWAHASTLVPSFTGSTTFPLPVPCTYDLELAASKYFYALPAGEVPLSFHFSGSVLHRGAAGTMQVVLIPWSCLCEWRMPIDSWRRMMDHYYPNGAWARLHADTAARLKRVQVARGLPSLDACIADLLDAADPEGAA